MRYLFDRLCFPGKKEVNEGGVRGDALVASVTREISRITSQRQYFCGFEHRDASVSREATVLDFGISRAIGEAVNVESGRQIALEIRHAILTHEPRLLRPQVSFRVAKSQSGVALFDVSGYLDRGDQVLDYKSQFMLTKV
jgi:predicted component of type VI protein secretion system